MGSSSRLVQHPGFPSGALDSFISVEVISYTFYNSTEILNLGTVMAFDNAFYQLQNSVSILSSGLTPEAHYLLYGWAENRPVNSAGTALAPDEMLQLFGNAGDKLVDIVSGLNASQISYLDQSTSLDVGQLLSNIDVGLLSDFMKGWGESELSFLDNLPSFDLTRVLDSFDSSELLGLLESWDQPENIEFLANLSEFDFKKLVGANADDVMNLLGSLGETAKLKIYEDFDASAFAWLDQAADFDLVSTMSTNFSFFKSVMSPEEALGLFGQLGGNMNHVVHSLRSEDLSYLDSAQGFDLGAFFGTLPDEMLAGFMEGWGTDQLQFLSELPSLDFEEMLGGFDPNIFAEMIGGWDDPGAISFLGDLDSFDFSGMLEKIPDVKVADLAREWNSEMLSSLSDIGGSFDPNAWFEESGAGELLPAGVTWEQPSSSEPKSPGSFVKDIISGGGSIPIDLSNLSVQLVGNLPANFQLPV